MSSETYIAAPGGLPATGMRLGKYQIVRRIGAGGMGAVYEAIHGEIGKRVAIKVLSPAVAAIPEARARFLREAQLTSKVRHPHAVDVTDMGTEGDQTFLVMELLDGEDLAACLDRTGQMDVAELVDVMLPVCSAVSAAHAAGIIHRDIKPQNIFLARGVHGVVPKVLDFGISKSRDGSAPQPLTGTDAVIGTPYYLAPEQVADNRASSPASDQYALGVVLYECLTGLRPFQADSLFLVLQAIVAGSPAAPSVHRSGLDPQLEEVVMRAMDVDPGRRFPSVSGLARALLPFANERARLLWQEAFGAPQAGTRADAAFRGPGPARGGARGATPVGARRGPNPLRGATPGATTPGGLRGLPRGATPGSWGGAKSTPSMSVTSLRPRSRAPLAFGLLALGALGAGAIFYGRSGTEMPPAAMAPAPVAPPVAASAPLEPPPKPAPPPPRTYAASVVVEPATARIELDGRDAGRSPFARRFTADGTEHTLAISAEGFEPQTLSFLDAPPPSRITLVAAPAPAPAAAPGPSRPTGRRHGGGAASPGRPPADPALPDAPRQAPMAGGNAAPVID